MKNRDLFLALKELSEEDLDKDAVVYDPNNIECYSVEETCLLSDHKDKDKLDDIFDDDMPMICLLKVPVLNTEPSLSFSKVFLDKEYRPFLNLTDQLNDYIRLFEIPNEEAIKFLNLLKKKLKDEDDQSQINQLIEKYEEDLEDDKEANKS